MSNKVRTSLRLASFNHTKNHLDWGFLSLSSVRHNIYVNKLVFLIKYPKKCKIRRKCFGFRNSEPPFSRPRPLQALLTHDFAHSQTNFPPVHQTIFFCFPSQIGVCNRSLNKDPVFNPPFPRE